ncbi:MAG TPA: acyl carrier protein [Dongiaceae bacterium]|nr:acyl carrier protein [Dongiaceae bacterium]
MTDKPVEKILPEVCALLARFRKTEIVIGADTDIARDLNLDSLAVMDLMMEIEDTFDISIPLNMVPEITTVRQLAETIRSIRQKNKEEYA